MVNYAHHLKLLLLLCPLVVGLSQEEQQLEHLHRNKRTLTTICVEIQPSGAQEEPYFMCKGADFSRGGGAPAQQQQASEQQQPINNYPQPAAQSPPTNTYYPQPPFPSFPSFGAGYLPIAPAFEEASRTTPASSYQNQPQSAEPHGTNYGSEGAAAYAPAPAAQSYGLPAVPYPAAGGPAEVARGAAAGSSPAATPNSYADAAAKKSSPAGQTAPLAKPQSSSSQASNGNAYETLVGSRHHTAMDEDVLTMPDVRFQPEEFNSQYRRPVTGMGAMVGAASPMMQLQQPTAPQYMSSYYDDPVMRTFYASLEPNEPQVAQAAPMQQQAPLEPVVAQLAPEPASAYSPVYAQPAAAPTPPQTPAAQPIYNAYAKPAAQSLPVDGSACNSCNRPCATPVESSYGYNTPSPCPSFQPVIIAMPCYGQQQPTHYLGLPGAGGAFQRAQARESILSSPFGGAFGAPFGMGQQIASNFNMASPQVGSPFGMSSPQVGAPFGMGSQPGTAYGMSNHQLGSSQAGSPFGISSQPGSAYGMSSPQLGSSMGMSPQVGAPFGMPPMLNPFGPFGNLNPFNPFNRILGAPAPTTALPKMRLFSAPEESTTGATSSTATSPAAPQFQLSFSSSTIAPAMKMTTDSTDATVGASRDPGGDQKDDGDEDDDDDENENEASESPHIVGTTQEKAADVDDDVSKSLESKNQNADELLNKSEDKLKANTRKRQNSRYSNNPTQKRKYLQRL